MIPIDSIFLSKTSNHVQEEVEEDPILVVVDAETGQHVPIGKHQASAQVS